MLGMSIGIAFANSCQQQSASKIIARADAAMYRAKQAGKRTVMVAPDEDVPAATEEPT
jgi:GGDEF domain-containing protein